MKSLAAALGVGQPPGRVAPQLCPPSLPYPYAFPTALHRDFVGSFCPLGRWNRAHPHISPGDRRLLEWGAEPLPPAHLAGALGRTAADGW